MVLQEVRKWHRKRRTRSNLRRWSKSATKIQAFVRGSLSRKRQRDEQEKQKTASRQLQAVNRKMCSKKGHKKRKKRSKSSLKRQSKSATKIQALFRGRLCRQNLNQQRRDSASTQIEAAARGFLCRNEHLGWLRDEERSRTNSNRSHRRVDSDIDCGTADPLQQSKTWYDASTAYNLITVFQAAPLAWLDANGDARRLKRLDLHFERETITNALVDSTVAVDFEIATDDRFGKFLAKGGGRAIHVSCHGKSTFLAFEDGWGQLQYMKACVLKNWISRGGSNLEFVFVSACDSWAIGKIFADAGVPHVVCCDKQTTLLDSGAAVKFTKALYQALAWGQPLQKAFELAQQELSVHPSFQASQFCLLPENGNHDVPIFSPDVEGEVPPISNQDTTPLPLTTDFFVRDDLEVYRTVRAIKDWRMVRVMGAQGIGKETLVQECCQYLRDRQKVVNIEEIIWKSVTEKTDETMDILARCFWTLFKQWRSRSGRTAAIRECRRFITRHFHEKKALLVIEAKHLDKMGVTKMFSFLNRLLQETNHLKLVVIHGAHITPEDVGELPSAFEISVDSLNIESTVQLFARLCKHVPNRGVPRVRDAGDLWRLLSPKNQSLGLLSKRQAAILRQLGGSNPRDICSAASRITEEEFLALVELGVYQGLDLFGTYTDLLLLAFEFERRIALRKEREDADGVITLDRKLRALKLLMKEFQNAEKLTSLMDEKLVCLLQSEKDEKDSWLAKFAELQTIESLIRKEEQAITAWLVDSRSSLFNSRIRNEQVAIDEKLVYTTGAPHQDSGPSSMAMDLQISSEMLKSKHGIESCIRLLNNYCRENFNKAASIQIHLSLLKELLHFKLAVSSLEAWSSQLGAALCTFTARKDWDQATATNKLLDKFQFRIKREESAKRQATPGLTTRRGVIKIASQSQSTHNDSRPLPPPMYIGISLVAKNRRRRKEILSIVDRMLETLKSRPNANSSDESVSAATQATAPISISSMNTSFEEA